MGRKLKQLLQLELRIICELESHLLQLIRRNSFGNQRSIFFTHGIGFSPSLTLLFLSQLVLILGSGRRQRRPSPHELQCRGLHWVDGGSSGWGSWGRGASQKPDLGGSVGAAGHGGGWGCECVILPHSPNPIRVAAVAADSCSSAAVSGTKSGRPLVPHPQGNDAYYQLVENCIFVLAD
jgi:hypothetical protein